MNDNEPYFAFSATLRIKNAPHIHKEFERKTGLCPSHVHSKGDIANAKSGRVWKNDIWMLDSPLPEEDELTKHILWLKDMLEPHMKYILELKKRGVDIDIFCGYRSDCDNAGFNIMPNALKLFIDLDIPVEFSVIIT